MALTERPRQGLNGLLASEPALRTPRILSACIAEQISHKETLTKV